MATINDTAATAARMWRRDAALPFQVLEEEVIVVDPKTREVHLLNETAARIWTLLGSKQSVGELVAALEQEYQADAAVLRAEVEAFVSDMSRKGLCAAVNDDGLGT
jgi:hypothetical protein